MNMQPYLQEIQPAPLTVTVCIESMMLLCVFWKPPSWTWLCVALKSFPSYLEIFEQKMQWSILHVMNSHFSDSKCSTLCLTFCLLSGHSPVYEQASDTVVYGQPRYSCTPLTNGTEPNWISPPQVEQSVCKSLPAIKISKGKQPGVADRGYKF